MEHGGQIRGGKVRLYEGGGVIIRCLGTKSKKIYAEYDKNSFNK